MERLAKRNENGLAILKNAEADKWKEYKQLEEQGRLLKLPCKVGDIIYQIWYVDDKPGIKEIKIATLNNLVALIEYGYFGKTIFLTREEAEQKLKEMESDRYDNT